jgi:hypothetical protein
MLQGRCLSLTARTSLQQLLEYRLGMYHASHIHSRGYSEHRPRPHYGPFTTLPACQCTPESHTDVRQGRRKQPGRVLDIAKRRRQ